MDTSAVIEIVHSPTPLLGQHAKEVLENLLNLSPAEILSLREEKVIGSGWLF